MKAVGDNLYITAKTWLFFTSDCTKYCINTHLKPADIDAPMYVCVYVFRYI
jgi:hypothetical protein